jgi:anti-sigma-K factor RskA
MELHELTAAYALDALDAVEAEAYEQHLGQCEECREELAGLSEAAGHLAFATVAPAPPPRLRAVILERAAAERTNVVPLLRRRWVARGLGVAAAAAACVVVGLTVALTRSTQPQIVSIGVVRNANGTATMTVSGLRAAPHGKTYEAWVIQGGKAKPAGVFSGGTSISVRLRALVPRNAVVGVTIERAGGVAAPTMAPILSAHA